MSEPQRISRTLIEVKFIPRPRCENCRTMPAVVTVTRKHVTMDGLPEQPAVIGKYTRTETLCQPCANEVIREESMFLDSVTDDGKPMFIQSQTCLNEKLDSIERTEAELCGCNECCHLLDFFPELP